MTDPEEKAKFDQDLATFRDSMPSIYWAIYTGCIDKGFSEHQAFSIVLAFVGKPV